MYSFREGLLEYTANGRGLMIRCGFRKWSVLPALAADAPTKQTTFSKDVAPILQSKCQECHQPNSIAPMSLITYQDARPWARSIKERVAAREMPPRPIHRSVGGQ